MTLLNLRTSIAAVMLMSMTTMFSQTAADSTATVTWKRDSTMNALDYLFQRPNPSPRFDNKRFGDHLFITAGGGADWTRSDNSMMGFTSATGFRAGISIGDWVSPVHGWRLSFEGGQHHGLYDSRPYFFAASADYLINFTSLLKGDNPSRRFDFSGIAGLEFDVLHRCHHKLRTSYGIHFGVQPRVFVGPNTYLYLEPKIGIYTDNHDFIENEHRYDWNASVSVGVGYTINRIKGLRNVDNSLFDNRSFRNYMFYGIAGGLNLIGTHTNDFAHRLGGNVGIFFGKWLAPSSALRLSASVSDIRQLHHNKRWGAVADLDYLWSVNSTLNGFDPDRRIETNIIIGMSGMVANEAGGKYGKFNPGFHIGAQGIVNLNHNFGLYLEPSVRLFKRQPTDVSNDRSKTMIGVNLGLVYRTGGAKEYDAYRSEFRHSDFLNSRRWFFDVMGGVFMHSRTWRSNYSIDIAAGRSISPGNSWRLSGRYDYMENRKNYRALTLGLDYLGSISTLTTGYDPDRFFDLSLVAGLTGGMAHYNARYTRFIWGAHAGLRGAIRLSPALDFVIEPTLAMVNIPKMSRKFTPEPRVMAGFCFKPGNPNVRNSGEDAPIMDLPEAPRYFLSTSVGPTLYSETLIGRSMTAPDWGLDVAAGHWFSRVSGVEAGLSYDFIDRKGRRPMLYIGTIHAEYLLNITALITGNPMARFTFTGLVGGGLAWSNRSNGNIAPNVNVGLRTAYRVNDRVSITFTPTMSFWGTKLNKDRANNHNFIGVGRMPLGVTYDF